MASFNILRPADSPLSVPEGGAPSTPAAGTIYVYGKTDNRVYAKDDTGTEVDLSAWVRDAVNSKLYPQSTSDRLIVGNRVFSSNNPYVVVDVNDNYKAILLPRISNFQLFETEATREEGMLAFDSRVGYKAIRLWDGTSWVTLANKETPIAHGSLLNLLNDDHTIYVHVDGRGCCQVIAGGTQPYGELVWTSTSDPQKGFMRAGPLNINEETGKVGVNEPDPQYALDVAGEMRLQGLADGSLQVTNGVVSSGAGGATGGWTRDVANTMIYPSITTDNVVIGSNASGDGAAALTVKAAFDSYPILHLKSATNGQSAETVKMFDLGGNPYWVTFSGGGTIVGGSNLDGSALFQVDSTQRGFLPPRMTAAQRGAISAPLDGLIVYDTTNGKLYLRAGGTWQALGFESATASPDQVTGLVQWLKSSVGVTVNDDGTGGTPSNGGTAGRWSDQSGNSNHATQVTAGNRPVYQTNVVNGLPVLRFNGTSQRYDLTSFSALTAGEIFAVLKIDVDPPGASAQTGLWRYNNCNFTDDYPWTDGTVNPSFGTDTQKGGTNPTTSLTSFHCFNVRSSSGSYVARVNTETVVNTGTNTVQFTTTGNFLGNDGGGRYLDGDIAEIILYNKVLSTGERSTVFTYLNSRYGLSLS